MWTRWTHFHFQVEFSGNENLSIFYRTNIIYLQLFIKKFLKMGIFQIFPSNHSDLMPRDYDNIYFAFKKFPFCFSLVSDDSLENKSL